MPGAAGIVQSTTFAETAAPPIAMKWMVSAVASLVVQLRVKLVPSQDWRSASATSAWPHRTIVRALAAIRRLLFEGSTAFWLAMATERLVGAIGHPERVEETGRWNGWSRG